MVVDNINSPTFDQLYSDSHLYVFKLAELSEHFPDLVGGNLIRLCVGLKNVMLIPLDISNM